MRRLLLVVLGVGLSLGLWVEVADAQWFGRNKVQYRSFDFQVLETEHFDIYFYEDAREAALDVARMTERAYARLSRILQHEFTERKPIILYASHTDFQQTNVLPMFIDEGTGAVAEPLKNRIIIPLTGSYGDFEHVLIHELVHAFQFDVIYRGGLGLMEAGGFGGRPPLWFMEGMAEYLAAGDVDTHTQAWLRDATLSGYLRSIQEMSRRDDYLSYRFGQSLWAYIGETWGDEVIGILLQKSPRVGLERAFYTTLGLSLQELSREWMASVRSTYLGQVPDYQQPEHLAQRLTSHDELYDPWFLAPAISPDGNLMAYISQRDGFFPDLWLADARTGEVRRKLVETARSADFESLRFLTSSAAFSPDGRRLAFSSQSGGREVLHIYDLDRRRVARTLRFPLSGARNPSWSPDGTRIVFTGLDGGLSDLYITDLDGNLERLTEDRYAALLPAWSPDGRTIAYTTDRGGETDFASLRMGNYRVALYDLATDEVEILPHQDEGRNLNPVWAPDGRSVVWVSDRTETSNLYLFDLDEGELYQLTDLLLGVTGITPLSPVLSWAQQDGRLLFVYFEAAGYNIYAVDDPRELPRTPVERVRPPPALVAAAESETAPDPADPDPDPEPTTVTSFYREGGELRPSATLPERPPEEGPLTIRGLMEDPQLALPDTADFNIRAYRARLSPDMVGRPTIGAQTGGHYGNGLYGGSFISLSDMLGNHNMLIAGNVSGSFSDAFFFGGYSYLKNRTNYGIMGQQVPIYRFPRIGFAGFPTDDGVREVYAQVVTRDVIRSAQALASYPFSTFRRVELGVAAYSYSRKDLWRGYFTDTGEPLRHDEPIFSRRFLQPSAALVFDNSLFGWTGPISGRRYRAQISQSTGDFSFTEALLDFRNYTNLPFDAVLATRLLSMVKFGRDADAFPMYWGGPYFLRGYDGGSFSAAECAASRAAVDGQAISSCPIQFQLFGSSVALMNMEVRFPIVRELRLGGLGQFPPLDAVVFFDGGMAWDPRLCSGEFGQRTNCLDVSAGWSRDAGADPTIARRPLFSYGAGLRFNIFWTVLRMDYAFPINRPHRSGVFSFSFGYSY